MGHPLGSPEQSTAARIAHAVAAISFFFDGDTMNSNDRTCPRCHVTKAVTEYAHHHRDGRQHWCRECMTQVRRDWRARVKTQDSHQYSLVKLADRLRKRREYLQRKRAKYQTP